MTSKTNYCVKSARQTAVQNLHGEHCSYSVLVYVPRPGKSVNDVAAELGGVVPARGERVAAERSGEVIALVYDDGSDLTFPVVARV